MVGDVRKIGWLVGVEAHEKKRRRGGFCGGACSYIQCVLIEQRKTG